MNEPAAFGVLAFTSLLAMINPLGAVTIFLGMTAAQPAARRRRTILIAILAGAVILIAFAALGATILRFFGITTYAFRITGGIILFAIGWDMLQARRSRVKTTAEEELEGAGREDVAIIPLGIPTIAGPGAITTVIALMGQAGGWQEAAYVYTAIVAVLVITAAVLFGAQLVLDRLGQTGLNVVTRLMGLLIMVVGMQFVIDGVRVAAG